MAEQKFKAVRTEVLKFGPSPYIPNKERALPCLFHNEMESLIGTAETDVFGKPAIVFLINTTFRIILYKYNKRGDDEVRSYWFDLDCSDDPFHDHEGFLISRIETTKPEYGGFDPPEERRYFSWKTNYHNPDGVKKTAVCILVGCTGSSDWNGQCSHILRMMPSSV